MVVHDTLRIGTGKGPGPALPVIATTQLMLVLDGTIVNVALPSIQASLNLTATGLNWVLTAYALTFGGLLLAGGRAGDLFGRRRLFRLGLLVFAAASLLGGLAPTGGVLIAARALQGAGAAITAPAALSLLVTTFPAGPARTRALGVHGAMGAVGSVAGLLLGGALTQYLDWRWVLFINVPIAIAVLLGSAVLVEGDRDHGRVDLLGALTVTLGLGCLVYAINQDHGWTAPGTLGSLTAAAVLLTAFLVVQRVGRAPMLPRGLLRDRGRFGANLVMFLTGASMFATFFFLTLYMQTVVGYGPLRTGLAYLPFALGTGLTAGAIGPRLLTRLPERTVAVLGPALAAAGMIWLTRLSPDAHYLAVLLPGQLMAGTGLGLCFVTTTIAGVRGVAARDTGAASGLLNTSHQIGGAVGLAVLTVIASAATANPALPGSRTEGYTAALLAAGVLYLVALLIAARTFSGRSAGRGASGRSTRWRPLIKRRH